VNLKISIFLYVVILLSSGANIGLNTKFTQTVLCPGSKPPKKAASYILFVSLPLWTGGTYFHARVGRRKLMIVLWVHRNTRLCLVYRPSDSSFPLCSLLQPNFAPQDTLSFLQSPLYLKFSQEFHFATIIPRHIRMKLLRSHVVRCFFITPRNNS